MEAEENDPGPNVSNDSGEKLPEPKQKESESNPKGEETKW